MKHFVGVYIYSCRTEILIKYQKENFAEEHVYRERRLIGKCPLTPEEDLRFIPRLGLGDIGNIYLAELKCSGIGAGIMTAKVMDKKELEGGTRSGWARRLEQRGRYCVGCTVCLKVTDVFVY